MDKLSVGDMVVRRSYGEDILFFIQSLQSENKIPYAILQGINIRLRADSPLVDLKKVGHFSRSSEESGLLSAYKRVLREIITQRLTPPSTSLPSSYGDPRIISLPGRVLHLDGEDHYLQQCRELYRHLSIPVVAKHLPEQQQPEEITELLETYHPDILVITGHDGLLRKQSARDDVRHYRSSNFFREAIKKARVYEPDRDGLVIIAGACQSYFEALINAGANFASSPRRLMIHCYDPVLVADKIAYTSFDHTLRPEEVLEHTISGVDGIGGIETRGKHRFGLPLTSEWKSRSS